jgi:hypothetical protein
MKYLLISITTLVLLFSACNKDDDEGSGCTDFSASWITKTNSEEVESQWLFATDTSAAVVASVDGNIGSTLEINTELCGEKRMDITQYRLERRAVDINGEIREVPVHQLRTYLGVEDGFVITDVDSLPATNRAFAIEGVSSLEELTWPERANSGFEFPIFLNQSDQILSFEVPIGLAQPAYFIIRGNGEAPNRYIWVENVDESDLSFQYDALPFLQPQGPVELPNDAFWLYNIYGSGPFGTTRIATPREPALVQEEFGVELPNAATLPSFRLQAFDFTNTTDGRSYSPYVYDQVVQGLPGAIDVINPQISYSGNLEGVEIRTQGTLIQLIEISLVEQSDETSRLEWFVYGKPEHFQSFKWPQWPEALSGQRANLLSKNQNTPVVVYARQYLSSPPYSDILNAVITQDEWWEATQGLRVRGRAY